MKIIQDGKTNCKYLLIIALIAVFVGAVSVWELSRINLIEFINAITQIIHKPEKFEGITDWKTMRIPGAYEVQYPANWFISGAIVTYFHNNEDESQKKNLITVSISKNTDVGPRSIQEEKSSYEEIYGMGNIGKDIIVDGKNGFEWQSNEKTEKGIVIEDKPYSFLYMSVSYDKNKESEALYIFDRMVSGFKFLD